jgi:hypothetical protein
VVDRRRMSHSAPMCRHVHPKSEERSLEGGPNIGDGKRLASVSKNNSVRFWDTWNGKLPADALER